MAVLSLFTCSVGACRSAETGSCFSLTRLCRGIDKGPVVARIQSISNAAMQHEIATVYQVGVDESFHR